MKIAVIGAGKWGQNLVRTLSQMGRLESVAEVSQPLREKVTNIAPGIPVLTDHRDVLSRPVSAVAIATPAPTHGTLVREALQAGKDVFVEKPFVLTSAEAEELTALAKREGRVLMVGHLLLYQPAIQWIGAFLRSGELGGLRSLHQERLNLGVARSTENALWSLGVHDVAVLLHLVGDAPCGLQVVGHQMLTPGVEDDVFLHLLFPGWVTAHLHCSWLWPEKRRRLTVIGDLGMLTYDELEQAVTLHARTIDRAGLMVNDAGSKVVFRGGDEPLRLEMEHFLSRLADRGRPLSDGPSALAVVRVLEQAGRSLGGTVRQAA